MNIYKISCYSKCGSYFESYLQSVTVLANDEIEAKKITKDWLNKNNERFIYPETDWETFIILKDLNGPCVIDFYEDADYN